jgi:hypothetical protein
MPPPLLRNGGIHSRLIVSDPLEGGMTRLLIAAWLVLAGAAFAADHLVPEASVFAGNDFLRDFDAMVVSALAGAYSEDVKVRAVVFPSFQSEYAVGLKEKQGSYIAFCLRPELPLWGYEILKMMKAGSIKNVTTGGPADQEQDKRDIAELEASLPASFKDVPIIARDVGLERDVALRLIDLWEVMLRQARYDKEAGSGLDGVTYHFSMGSRYQDLAGQVWSPAPESTTGLLVRLVETLRGVCDGQAQDLSPQLRVQSDALRTRLAR